MERGLEQEALEGNISSLKELAVKRQNFIFDPNRCCEFCKIPLSKIKQKRGSKYCSRSCKVRAYNKGLGIRGLHLATGTTGTIGELVVAADLLRKGFEVFRAVSPSCSCDLAILKNGQLLRVEVRTGYRNQKTNHVRCALSPKNRDRFDIFAIVIAGTEILYRPELEKVNS